MNNTVIRNKPEPVKVSAAVYARQIINANSFAARARAAKANQARKATS